MKFVPWQDIVQVTGFEQEAFYYAFIAFFTTLQTTSSYVVDQKGVFLML